jgi:hypothetical protein
MKVRDAVKKREQGADATSPGGVFRDCPNCPEMVVVPALHDGVE